jgi:hypothetical protein
MIPMFFLIDAILEDSTFAFATLLFVGAKSLNHILGPGTIPWM